MSAKNEKHSTRRVLNNLRFMLKYAFKYTPLYPFVCLLQGVLNGFVELAYVLFIKYLFDAIEGQTAFSDVLAFVVAYAALRLSVYLFTQWFSSFYAPKTNLTLHEKMQDELYKKCMRFDLSCYDDPAFYDDFIWATREADMRVVQILQSMSALAETIISLFGTLAVVLAVDPVIAAAVFVMLVLDYFVGAKSSAVFVARQEAINPIMHEIEYIGRVFYLPEYAKELRQGDIASRLEKRYEETSAGRVTVYKRFRRRLLGWRALRGVYGDIFSSAGITSYLLLRYVLDPTMTLGDFSVGITEMSTLFWRLQGFTEDLKGFREHSLYAEKFRRFAEYEPTIKGTLDEVPPFESLQLKNLDFAYPYVADGKLTLKNINLEIKKGEKIALVGYNGAGKTTLIKLLMRLYDPTSGEILYNGQNIRDFVPESYRRHIASVFQDYKVFAATLAENVMGGEYRDEDAKTVLSALHDAVFDDKLKQLPFGIQTDMTTEFSADGTGLSGGEEQKIAIARVFAGKSELMILDEPSSALDPVAEYELNRSILRTARDRTVIFISHRLSTTRMADRIYMFSDGQIIETGSHDELMKQNGKYAEMYRVQAEKYRAAAEEE